MTASKFPAAGHEPSLAELMDPAVLARRLEEARARRTIALAAVQDAPPAPPPLPGVLRVQEPAVEPAAGPARPAWWKPLLVGLAVMATTAFGLIALLKPAPPEIWQGVSGIAMPDPVTAAPSPLAETSPATGSAAPGGLAVLVREVPSAALGPAPLRPRARPDDLVSIQIVQTERRRAAAQSAELVRTLSRVNQKTVGAMAEALGIRRSFDLPDGRRVTLDRRGLRLRP